MGRRLNRLSRSQRAVRVVISIWQTVTFIIVTCSETTIVKVLDLIKNLSLEDREKIGSVLASAPRDVAVGAQPSILVTDKSFWTEEGKSALLSRNDCLTENTFPTFQRRVKDWVQRLGLAHTPVDTSNLDCAPDFMRIFQKDADRTVEEQKRRVNYIEGLCLVHQKLQDYHQGGGYICALLSIFLSKEDLARIMWWLNASPRHHLGYYKAQPSRFFLDSMTLYELTKIYMPALSDHLTSLGFVKQNYHMFCVKWFVGLGLHMMPYSVLLTYMECFLFHDIEFIFKFSLVYLHTLEKEIIDRKTMTEVNGLLRNEDLGDHKKPHPLIKAWPEQDFFRGVIAEALKVNLNDKVNFNDLREREHREGGELLAQRTERIKEMEAECSDDEIVFSDED